MLQGAGQQLFEAEDDFKSGTDFSDFDLMEGSLENTA